MFFSHRHHAKSLAFVGHKGGVPPAFHLLPPGCPPAISRFVIAVVIWVAINGVFWRWLEPHIGQEVSEGIIPPLADFYSPPAIVFESLIGWIGTPPAHVAPSKELRTCPSRFSMAVGGFDLRSNIAPQTPTRSSPSTSQTCRPNSFFIPAQAQALPVGLPLFYVRDSDKFQSPYEQPGNQVDRRLNRHILTLGFTHGSNDVDSSEDHLAATGGPCAFIMAETNSKSSRRALQW